MRRVYLETFGCQMNVHDSLRILEVLAAEGFESTPNPLDADLVVFNGCTIREKAEQKLRSEVGRLRRVKDRRGAPVIAVGGCVAAQWGTDLLRDFPHLDIVFGPDRIPELPSLVQHIEEGFPPVASIGFDLDAPSFLPARTMARAPTPTALVTTMKGCDERCTFCIVPLVRGPERYRPASEVVDEVRRLVDEGVSEVTLLGQTVNSYRDRADVSIDFPILLGLLDAISGLRRLRYASPHPRHLTDRLIEAHSSLASLCPHVHLPVQSGSDRILRRMKRRHGRRFFLDRLALLRERVEDLAVTTDLIVGFPGESQADFEETLSLVEEARFDGAFTFTYSPRPGTAAARLPASDTVPHDERVRRLRILQETVERVSAPARRERVGRVEEVLVEGPSKTASSGQGRADGTSSAEGRVCAPRAQLTGRTRQNRIVNFDPPPGRSVVGRLVRVEIVSARAHSLGGRVLAEA